MEILCHGKSTEPACEKTFFITILFSLLFCYVWHSLSSIVFVAMCLKQNGISNICILQILCELFTNWLRFRFECLLASNTVSEKVVSPNLWSEEPKTPSLLKNEGVYGKEEPICWTSTFITLNSYVEPP